MSIKVGDKVETYGWFEGLTGSVTKIIKGYTSLKPGLVEVEVIYTEPACRCAVKVGDIAAFSYYNWEIDLRRV